MASPPATGPVGSEGQHDLSTRRSFSRASNANHLLNFQSSVSGPSLSGTVGRWTQTSGMPAGNRRRPQGNRTYRPQMYDRLQFLQANYRFLISDAVDIQKYEADADMMVDWDDVVMVDFITPTPLVELVCPISLAPLVCPQITPCGHLFSFESIMAHMITQGGAELRASACPLCTTPIVPRELRLASVRQVQALRPGNEVTLHLLCRERASIIPHPVAVAVSAKPKNIQATSEATGEDAAEHTGPWAGRATSSGRGRSTSSAAAQPGASQKLACNPYAKFTTVGNPLSLWIAQGETLAHRVAAVMAEGGNEASYELPPLLAAMESLMQTARAWTERRERHLLENIGAESSLQIIESQKTPEEAGKEVMRVLKSAMDVAVETAERHAEQSAASKALESEFPALALGGSRSKEALKEDVGVDNPAIQTGVDAQGEEELHSTAAATAVAAGDGNGYYLYQAEDGQWLFLCPLNMRMLVHHYGSYTACPSVLKARILQIESEVQSEATRKRLRPLAHLPLSGSFQICEVDLSGVLPPEAIEPFAQELSQRQKKRSQTAKLEVRRAEREAKAAAAAVAAASATVLSHADLAAMPLPGASLRVDALEFNPGGATGGPIERGDGDDNRNEATPTPEEGAAPSSGGGSMPIPSGPSFAQMAKFGFAATGPALGDPESFPESSPGGQSPSVSGAWGSPAASAAPVPGRMQGSGGAHAHAPPLPLPPSNSSSESGNKKKSGKKMLLLSTAQRRY